MGYLKVSDMLAMGYLPRLQGYLCFLMLRFDLRAKFRYLILFEILQLVVLEVEYHWLKFLLWLDLLPIVQWRLYYLLLPLQ